MIKDTPRDNLLLSLQKALFPNQKTEKESLMQKRLTEFTEKHKERVLMWQSAHPRHRLPIQWSDELQDWVWQNRKNRRRK